jgi:hypothetical protein
MYVGTEAEIRVAIEAMKQSPKGSAETVAATERYLAGDKTATHNIAYNEIPVLEPCRRIASSTLSLGSYAWEHTNVWGFPYMMKCDSAEIKQIIIQYKRKYYRCVRAWFKNLCYESVSGKWTLLGDFYLGPAYLFDVKDDPGEGRTMNNLLYVAEEIYAKLEDAEDKMLSEEYLIFKGFCDDIFADG